MPWVCVRDIPEETVDRDQPAVASRHAVPSLDLEVVKEGEHCGGAEIGQPQPNHLAAALLSSEAEEELDEELVAMIGDLVRIDAKRVDSRLDNQSPR